MLTEHRAGETRLTLVYLAVLACLTALMRAVPYYVPMDQSFLWNLMPVGALALFAGSRLRSRWAWLVPVAVMFLSDLLLIYPLAKMGMSSFALFRTPLIYGSFALYVALGRLVRPGERSPLVIGGAALLGGVQFFLLTNFAVWLAGSTYPASLEGLGQCYLAAVPFYRNTLASDLLYAALIFSGHAALVWGLNRQSAPALANAGPHWQASPAPHSVTRRGEVSR